jgi:predicted acetyltransferase
MVTEMEEREETKRLWSICFADPEEFTELYFRHRFSSETNHVWREGGEIVAALQTIPYPMLLGGRTLQTAYMSGVCTHSDFRNRGIMRRLMADVHRKLYSRGVAAATLIPAEQWLFDYYGTMGYAGIFRRQLAAVYAEEVKTPPEISLCEVSDADEELCSYFCAIQSERDFYLLHTADDLQMVFADIAMGDAAAFVAKRNGEICGLVIAYGRENRIEIEEITATDKVINRLLITKIAERFPGKPLMLVLPPSDGNITDMGMMRVINAEALLSAFAAKHRDAALLLDIHDEEIAENCGRYVVANGMCRRASAEEQLSFRRIDIKELSFMIAEQEIPYMNLMIN